MHFSGKKVLNLGGQRQSGIRNTADKFKYVLPEGIIYW